MLNNLITSVNVVMPMMLIVALGYILYHRGKLTDDFVKTGVWLSFSIGFPCSLVNSFSQINFTEAMDVRFVVLLVSITVLSAVIPMIVVPRFVANRAIAASMVQSMFRTNVMVQGYGLMVSVYGEENVAAGAVALPFLLITNNIIAPIIFVSLVPNENGKKPTLGDFIKKIFSNPLFCASVLGLTLSLLHIKLPTMVSSSLSQIGKVATPLSLICMGAGLRFDTVRSGLKYTLPTALVRLVVVPAAAVVAGFALGFRGVELGSIFLLTSTASGTAGYVMAGSMGGDTDIASQTICLTVTLSAFTVTAGLFLLLQLGLI